VRKLFIRELVAVVVQCILAIVDSGSPGCEALQSDRAARVPPSTLTVPSGRQNHLNED